LQKVRSSDSEALLKLLGRVLINQSGETHGAHVRFAPNSDAKADILGPPLRALGDVETT
jgi:hypothetical protein